MDLSGGGDFLIDYVDEKLEGDIGHRLFVVWIVVVDDEILVDEGGE